MFGDRFRCESLVRAMVIMEERDFSCTVVVRTCIVDTHGMRQKIILVLVAYICNSPSLWIFSPLFATPNLVKKT